MKKILVLITTVIGLALVALLAYSIERSAWFLALYETTGEEASGPALAAAAAFVAELGAVALIVGEAAGWWGRRRPQSASLAGLGLGCCWC